MPRCTKRNEVVEIECARPETECEGASEGRFVSRAWAVLLVAAAALLSNPVQGQGTSEPEPSQGLQWHGAPGCPDASVFEAAVDDLDGLQQSTVEVWLERRAREVELRLRWRRAEASGTRVLHSGDCDELVEAAALWVDFVLSGDLSSGAFEAEPTEPEPPAETASSETGQGAGASEGTVGAGPDVQSGDIEIQAPAPSEESPLPLRWSMFLGLGLDGFSVPGATGSLHFGGGLSLRRLEAAAYLRGIWPTIGRADNGGALRLGLVALGLRVGVKVLSRPWVLSAQAALEVGFWVGRGKDITAPSTAVVPWIAPELGVELGRWFGPWKVALAVSGRIQPRPRFVVDGIGEVFRPGLLGGRVGVVLGFELD